MLYTWKLLMEIILRSSIFFILTSRALPKGLYRLFWTVLADEFWLAVKLYRHTGTNWLLDPSLCDCMDSLCCDHWQAVVIVGCLVLARLPILRCLVVLTSRRTKGVVCCVLSSEHANMKYRNIDLLGKVVPRLSNWNRRKVCRKAVSPFVTVEVRLCKRKSNDFLGSWRVRDTSK